MLLLLQATDPLIAHALTLTAAEQRCFYDPNATDITVCGLRNADRFRVPFATHVTARRDDVATERATLIHEATPMEDMGPFLVGGGMAGVSATVGGSGASVGGVRPLAP